MKRIKWIILGILLALGVFFIYKAITDPTTKERTYTCKVLAIIGQEYDTHTKSGYHTSRYFTLVLYAEGKRFSLDVSPDTWAMAEVGQTLFFTIAPYQLDNYQSRPLSWDTVAAVYFGVLVVIALSLFLISILPDDL